MQIPSSLQRFQDKTLPLRLSDLGLVVFSSRGGKEQKLMNQRGPL